MAQKKLIAGLLAIFLGGLGVHKFYLGNTQPGVIMLAATIGGFTIGLSFIPFFWNVYISLRGGEEAGDDPWEANTLEWATSSPPPAWNFDRLPAITSERPLFDARHGRSGKEHA